MREVKEQKTQQRADRQGRTPVLGAAADYSHLHPSSWCSLPTATPSPSVGSILKQDTAQPQKVKHAATGM